MDTSHKPHLFPTTMNTILGCEVALYALSPRIGCPSLLILSIFRKISEHIQSACYVRLSPRRRPHLLSSRSHHSRPFRTRPRRRRRGRTRGCRDSCLSSAARTASPHSSASVVRQCRGENGEGGRRTVSISSRFCIISSRGCCTPQKATYCVQSQLTEATRLVTDGRVATPGLGCPTSMPAGPQVTGRNHGGIPLTDDHCAWRNDRRVAAAPGHDLRIDTSNLRVDPAVVCQIEHRARISSRTNLRATLLIYWSFIPSHLPLLYETD